MKKFYLILPIIALMISSCQKEGIDQVISVTPVIKPPSDLITGSVSGYITDVNQLPISDAMVTHHDEDPVFTDSEGKFSFVDINLFRDGSLIEVKKDGFFKGSKKIYASENNIVDIQLSTKMFQDETNTSNGGRVDINDAFVVLPSGAYSTEDDQPYSGNIKVYGKWINPTDIKDSYEMPGDLTGYDLEKNLRALICFSMLKIGIEDSSDEKIELPVGKVAMINFPIPADLRKFAPAEIPLWYYDEANGSWIEEGIASLDGDSYKGEVTHISVWSCSASFPVIEISGHLHSNGSELGTTQVKLIDSQTGYISYLTTNESGYFTTKIPSGSTIRVELESECSNGLLNEELGEFHISSDIGIKDILHDGTSTITISGALKDCSGADLSSTYIKVDLGGNNHLVSADQFGVFQKDFGTSCSDSEISIVGINLETGMASEVITQPIFEEVDFGDVQLCDSIEAGHYIDYNTKNWDLDHEVNHTWSTILVSNTKTYFTPSIVHKESGEVFLSGGFSFLEGSDLVNYQLTFNSQGFTIAGTCKVTIVDEGAFKSYRFHSNKQNPDPELEDIGIVDFDLVYYD